MAVQNPAARIGDASPGTARSSAPWSSSRRSLGGLDSPDRCSDGDGLGIELTWCVTRAGDDANIGPTVSSRLTSGPQSGGVNGSFPAVNILFPTISAAARLRGRHRGRESARDGASQESRSPSSSNASSQSSQSHQPTSGSRRAISAPHSGHRRERSLRGTVIRSARRSRTRRGCARPAGRDRAATGADRSRVGAAGGHERHGLATTGTLGTRPRAVVARIGLVAPVGAAARVESVAPIGRVTHRAHPSSPTATRRPLGPARSGLGTARTPPRTPRRLLRTAQGLIGGGDSAVVRDVYIPVE